MIDASQLFEQRLHLFRETVPFLSRGDDGVNHLAVAAHYLVEGLLVERVALQCHLSCPDEFVGDASQCTHDDDDRLLLLLDNPFYAQYAGGGAD